MEESKEICISFKELSELSNQTIKVSNDYLYNMVEKITNKYVPAEKNYGGLIWAGIYLEADDGSYLPVDIAKYGKKKTYFISIGNYIAFVLEKGNGEENKTIEKFIKSIFKGMKSIEENKSNFVDKIPIEFKTGKILGKYVLGKKLLIDDETAKKIEIKYMMHIRDAQETGAISLREYLDVAKICYDAVFHEEIAMAPRDLYDKYADWRHGGMLDLKEDDEKEYLKWLNSNSWKGSHPFEIIKGYKSIGIELLPPKLSSKRFVLVAGSHAYAKEYIEILNALIEKGIAFEAPQLRDMLDYLSGKTYFSVNKISDDEIYDIEGMKQFVEWDKPKIAKRYP
ncbi:MAG: hypothetical protein QXS03_01230 [Candidatus Micrarchaeaceae archaeon]